MICESKMDFFLPESDDLVDPNFEFLTDTYSDLRSKDLEHDVYAHQLFDAPNCDGLLITKSNITPPIELQVAARGGVHAFFRFPKTRKIIGDCGAFQFIDDPVPPYTNEEIYAYYERLGFDLGISLDHVIVEFDLRYDEGQELFKFDPTDDMKLRFRLSLDNAKELLHLTSRRNAKFKPIGSVQGWSPSSYHTGVRELIDAGYDYIAIGGVAKASNDTIIAILSEIRSTVLNAGVKLHILGVARLNILDDYMKTNVASCDSAGSLMQAFKSTKDNYYAPIRNYTAVRIPAVNGDSSPKVLKHLKPFADCAEKYDREKQRLSKLEQGALKAIRAYAKHSLSLEKAMAALKTYENQFDGEQTYYPMFEETLRDRPWENCPCAICKKIGVEVIIMRGNNRNRRRGFHNTFVFFEQFKRKVGYTP